MPQGKGTYGSKVGRPKKTKAKRARSMPLDKEQAEKAAYLEIYANLQQASKPVTNNAVRTAIKPITHQKPLSNQQIS